MVLFKRYNTPELIARTKEGRAKFFLAILRKIDTGLPALVVVQSYNESRKPVSILLGVPEQNATYPYFLVVCSVVVQIAS